jgi:hypothetical protein
MAAMGPSEVGCSYSEESFTFLVMNDAWAQMDLKYD